MKSEEFAENLTRQSACVKFSVIFERIKRIYKELVGIRKSYQEHLELIKRERDCYTVYAIMYATNGDIQSLKTNPHRPINCAYIEAALEDALRGLNQEINEIADKLKKCGIDIDDDEEL